MARLTWIGHSASVKSSNIDSLRLMNAYSEVTESQQGKTNVGIYRTPGLKRFLTLTGGGPVRGLYRASNGRVFAVQGNQLLEIFASATQVVRGSFLKSDTGPVSMADNSIDMMITDVAGGYRYNFVNNLFETISDPAFNAAGPRVSFLDSYLVFPEPNSQRFWWTDSFSSDIADLNFASAEASPDLLVSQLVVHREIWNFGVTSTEIWYSTGDSTTPFARIGGGFLHQGCAASWSPARVGETIVWLSANDEGQGMVLQATGYSPQRISTHAVEEALKTYPTISDAIGWSEQDEGHLYYTLVFPSANHTWVFDMSTKLWHERGWLNPATGFFERHRANCYAFAFGKHLVGDHTDGRVYSLEGTTYDDDGVPLVLEAVLPPLFDGQGGNLLEHTWLQIDAETGGGADGGVLPASQPSMMLALSDDGGHTWSPALVRSMGRIGDTRASIEWYRLGTSYDRRYRLRVSDPVKVAILGAITEYRPLRG